MSISYEDDEISFDIGTGITFYIAWQAIKDANRWRTRYYRIQKKYRALLKKGA